MYEVGSHTHDTHSCTDVISDWGGGDLIKSSFPPKCRGIADYRVFATTTIRNLLARVH